MPLYPEGLIPETVMVCGVARLFVPMVKVAVPEDQLAALTVKVC